MRIRHKPWARPELEQCEFFVTDAVEAINHWAEKFPREQPLHIELGCGKGRFIAELAAQNPQINYIAVDMKDAMLGLARRKACAAFEQAGREVDNLLLSAYDIERIDMIFGERDLCERIYINFCNPWPKRAEHKKRLTHTRQLTKYRTFLHDGGEIRFKTDDDALYGDTLVYLRECGFEIADTAEDLHACEDIENILTEHEKMFSEAGVPIKYVRAIKR